MARARLRRFSISTLAATAPTTRAPPANCSGERRSPEQNGRGRSGNDGLGAEGEPDHDGRGAHQGCQLEDESRHVGHDQKGQRSRRHAKGGGRVERRQQGADDQAGGNHREIDPEDLGERRGGMGARSGEELQCRRDTGEPGQGDAAPVQCPDPGADHQRHAGEGDGGEDEQRAAHAAAIDQRRQQHDQDREGEEDHHRDRNRDEGHGAHIADAHAGAAQGEREDGPAFSRSDHRALAPDHRDQGSDHEHGHDAIERDRDAGQSGLRGPCGRRRC